MTIDTVSLREQRDAEIAELRRVLPQPLLDQERYASSNCWHAYCFMGALERTRQFAADYEHAFRSTFGVGCEMRPELGTKEFETLWRMRQAADDEVVSYPLYHEVSFPQVRRQPPAKFSRPHLVFVRRQRRPLWRRRLIKVLDERYRWDLQRVAAMPEFHVSNYVGLPSQDILRATVSHETKMHLAMQNARTFSIERKIVPLKQVLGKLSEEDRREAAQRLKEEVRLGLITLEAAPPARCAEIVESSYGWIDDRALSG